MCHVRYRVQDNGALALGSSAAGEFDLYRSVDSHNQLPWLCLALVHMVHNVNVHVHVHVRTHHELLPYCVSYNRHTS